MSHHRLVSAAISALSALALSACGGIVESPAESQPGATVVSATTPDLNVVSPGSPLSVDPESVWTIELQRGLVTPSGPRGGPPSVYVCLTIGVGKRQCTPIVESFEPTWNYTFSATTYAAIRLQTKLEFLNSDGDHICATTNLDVTPDLLETGRFGTTCGLGRAYFTIVEKK